MLLKLDRTVSSMLLVALALAVAAPAAHAGHKKHKRHHRKHCEVRVVEHVHHAPRVVVHDHYNGAAFAGFVGGLILGTVVSRAEAAPVYYAPPVERYYYDPYCGERYSSFDACTPHFRHSNHPRVVNVIDVRSGACVERYNYRDGYWRAWDTDRDWDG